MKLIFRILLFLFPILVFSQEKTISFHVENELVSEVLVLLENEFDVRFSYQDSLLKNKRISIDKTAVSLSDILDEITSKIRLNFQTIDERYIIINPESSIVTSVQLLDGVLIKGYLAKGISKKNDGSFHINPVDLAILPGLTEADIFESIQQLPGVISPNETATGLIVRGGSSDQNRVIWDGINVYHKGHLFGMISAFNPNTTESVAFYNKGTNPRFGERVSSVIDISSSSEVAEKLKLGVGFNGLNVDAFVSIPIIENKISVQASIRRSYTEVYESFTFTKLSDKIFQNTKIKNVQNTNNDFFFIDYNFKLNIKPNKNNSFYFSTIYVDNKLDYLVEDVDKQISFNDILTIKNEGYSARWDKIWNKNVSQHTQVYFSKYRLAYNFITTEENEEITDFNKRNNILDSGFSSEVIIALQTNHELSLGYQYTLKDVGYIFREEGDLSFVLDSDQTIARTHGFFSNYNLKNSNKINVSIGFRVSYFQELNSIHFEPRILAHKELFENLTLQVSGEIKNQIISEIDETVLSDLAIENKLWRLSNGEDFPIINSKQVSTGLVYNNNGWTLDADTYYKRIEGITTLSLGFLNPDGTSFHKGKQNILGLDFYIKKDFNALKTWVSYSYSNAKNRFQALNENNYFTASTSIKHTFTASVAYSIKQFQIALAWNWRTGKPYTLAVENGDTSGLTFEGINTETLPNYHRLDFSTTYKFNFSKHNDLKGKIGFSIRNVYNKNNQLSKEYIGNNNLDDPIEAVDKFSLGFTLNFLFRVYF